MLRMFHHAIIRPRRIGLRTLVGACMAVLAALLISPAIIQAAPTHTTHSASPKTAFHAYYTGSVPKANAILTSAPTQVIVHFAENVNPEGSNVIVYDSKGTQVSTAAAQVDRTDLKTMTVSMKGDGSQVYLVIWHTVSADDGDSDIGGFNFLVNADASTVQAVQSSNGTGTTTTATNATSSGTPIWLTILIAIVALLVGGGALYFAQRSGWAPTPASNAAPGNSPNKAR